MSTIILIVILCVLWEVAAFLIGFFLTAFRDWRKAKREGKSFWDV